MTKITSNIPKHEIYDVTFKCPFNCIMSGSSGSGKTTRLLELSVIMLSQMLFKPGDYKFNVLSENVQYLLLFKSPRNSSKIIHLAKQVSPYDNKFIVRSYREATSQEFTYLLFDFHQSTPEKVRLRSKIFPSQGTMTVHMNESTK